MQLGWRPAHGKSPGISLRTLLRRLLECPVGRETSGKLAELTAHQLFFSGLATGAAAAAGGGGGGDMPVVSAVTFCARA